MICLVGNIHHKKKGNDDGYGNENGIKQYPTKATLYGLGNEKHAEGKGEHEIFVADNLFHNVLFMFLSMYFLAHLILSLAHSLMGLTRNQKNDDGAQQCCQGYRQYLGLNQVEIKH